MASGKCRQTWTLLAERNPLVSFTSVFSKSGLVVMACFEDDGLVVVGLYTDVWELVMLEGVGGCITAPTLVAGADLGEDEEIGCLAMVGEVVGSQFLTVYSCLEAVLFVSGADSLTADKDG